MSYMTSGQRTQRLVKLYSLRASVEEEIVKLEAEINTEALLLTEARRVGVKRPRRTAACGTDSGYYRHRRRDKTPPCDACRLAHNLAERRRFAKAKEPAAQTYDSEAA